eukprot:g9846.t1
MVDVTQVVVSLVLLLLMAYFASSLDMSAFKNHLKKPKALILGMACQFLLLPLLSLLSCLIFGGAGLSREFQLALILVCSCPGGSTSNIWIFIFGGNISLSVAMTAASSVLAIVFLPLNVFIYSSILDMINDASSSLKIDFVELVISAVIIVVGLFIGFVINIRKWRRVQIPLFIFAMLAFLFLVVFAPLVNSRSSQPFWTYPGGLFIAVLFPASGGFFLALFISRKLLHFPKPSCTTISVEVSFQNVGIAIAIINSSFPPEYRAEVMGVPILYQLLNTITCIIYCLTLLKLGWLGEVEGDESMTLCKLLARLRDYRKGKSQSKYKYVARKLPEQSELRCPGRAAHPDCRQCLRFA